MSTHTASDSAASIHPATTVGTVRLTVSDLGRARDFYERVLGLGGVELDSGTVGLRGGDGQAGELLVELYGDASAPRLNRRATGLFHLALRFPSRRELASTLARVAHTRWPLDGASDHLVSEALYLSDPDGNGVELYRDRRREQWSYRDGALQMATLPLDLDGLLGELHEATEVPASAPAETTMGHVHLQVSELPKIEAFYHGLLGFDVVVRSYPGALFVSAGGYHHHLGLNTWNSRGSGPPAPGSVGLRSFDIVLPGTEALEPVLARLRAAGAAIDTRDGGVTVADPSGNQVILRTR